jgi:hypothetical protein
MRRLPGRGGSLHHCGSDECDGIGFGSNEISNELVLRTDLGNRRCDLSGFHELTNILGLLGGHDRHHDTFGTGSGCSSGTM